ncbi:unnamed protein product, partial [Allacma fusca]
RIPQLRLAGFDSCPECKMGWSDDMKKFRPIQEICGHVKCRQYFIKAVASNEDNCFQCDILFMGDRFEPSWVNNSGLRTQ